MVYENNIDPVHKRYWPGTKAKLTQYKSDIDPVQKRYWRGTKAIPFDTVSCTVTQRVCTGSTGTRYKSGTGIRYRNVYRNGVQDVYRKVPYRYLVPYTTIPNRYHMVGRSGQKAPKVPRMKSFTLENIRVSKVPWKNLYAYNNAPIRTQYSIRVTFHTCNFSYV